MEGTPPGRETTIPRLKKDPLAELERTVQRMRALGVTRYGDIELGPEPADLRLCVHRVPLGGICEMCARDTVVDRPNIPRLKRLP